MENTTSSPKKLSKKALLFVLGSFLFLGVIILLSSGGSSGTPASAPEQQQAQEVSVGQNGFLKVSGQTEVLVASSKDNFDKLIKASVANDTLGMSQMVQSGGAFFVNVGTKVLVIDVSVGARQVRILEGKEIGNSGWVPSEFVSPSQ